MFGLAQLSHLRGLGGRAKLRGDGLCALPAER
jgi:hypothetical protein